MWDHISPTGPNRKAVKDDQTVGIFVTLNEETATQVSAAEKREATGSQVKGGGDEPAGWARKRREDDGEEEEWGGWARDEGGLRQREEEQLEVEAWKCGGEGGGLRKKKEQRRRRFHLANNTPRAFATGSLLLLMYTAFRLRWGTGEWWFRAVRQP